MLLSNPYKYIRIFSSITKHKPGTLVKFGNEPSVICALSYPPWEKTFKSTCYNSET